MENLPQVLKQHKLTQEDYAKILSILGREPNLVEIGIFSAMWSEHCSYKSSKIYLNGFPTRAPWVIQGPGENAGVIDIGGGYGAVFKMESHNHPSFIEPYAGAATGVGGIMRDIFTMGARVVASLNAIRFGDITRRDLIGAKHRYLLRGVVAGIGGYGNCMGVPTIGGEMSFESSYEGNILVNAFSLGIVKNDAIFYGKASGIGNPVIYVGSKTGRDGLGGAVMSSDSFSEYSKALRPTVQVGDPFTEKLLLEACLELFKRDLIVGIQDMGAAGLTSSSFEMAGRSGSGMVMYLDKVPMREAGMTPYELMLSESQERMLICAKKGCEAEIMEIFAKWELDCAIIGEVTNSGKMELFWQNNKCAEIPIAPLSEKAPILKRPVSENPSYLDFIETLNSQELESKDKNAVFRELLKSPEVCDKAWVYSQYDSSVQTNTIVSSGSGGASVIRVKENGKGLGMSVASQARLCYLNPKEGAKQSVAKVGRDIALRGGRALAITDCLNFGSPENPEVMWQFKETCEGIKESCKALNTPVVSGNVSLYNQTNGKDIYPTPSIAGVGVIDNINNVLCSNFNKEGLEVYLLKSKSVMPEFGASLVAKYFGNSIKGVTAKISLQDELYLWSVLNAANERGILNAAVDVYQGGVAIALAKACVRGNMGCKGVVDLDFKALFGEAPTQVLVALESQNIAQLKIMLGDSNFELVKIAILGGENIVMSDIIIPLKEAKETFYGAFEEIIETF
ncbi:phosphoribosylformylglycinamidine synthase subunit PurL [Helicobacter turcicus]|uniref:Phosphoribosylformylglycinamidine synthase subunit PurL n=1 Tax=Helicobacter turcicus TaxID=2867412 RepID=A0ABS7JL41_9HELI|nr:phosphoribosylformylglycinamidine synthase subunit PurL [Helicobacter turcicus]MBX7490122.1 phosphoribosylformylglycinamidine synthase subunit PurL [Helicobacter turcicus]MBX7544981.1 phosphoribosylformylglycinamidine synthase subunit PurL [Helicobacter turcicus]